MCNPRKHGKPPYKLAVLHGGPGAVGDAAPLAFELGRSWGVLEPFQTKSTINGLVEELRKILDKHADLPIILLGHSWGAWLGFIMAAKFPLMVKKLILISSGPFEDKYAKKITATRLNRLNNDDQSKLLSIIAALASTKMNIEKKNKLMVQMVTLIKNADAFELIINDQTNLEYQYDMHHSIWSEAEQLRSTGKLLKFGERIKCPVVAIHGDFDPHPVEGVSEPLKKTLKSFKIMRLPDCGHYPWLEKNAKEKFYKILKEDIEEIEH